MLPALLLISTMTFQVTSYRSVPEQTDSTPFYTSLGLHVKKGFCAVSQDQLGKQINYGDVLYVEVPAKPELSRYCFVADTMARRNKRAVDFWVATRAEERVVQVRRGYVYKLVKPIKSLTTNTSSNYLKTTSNSLQNLIKALSNYLLINNKFLEAFNNYLTITKGYL